MLARAHPLADLESVEAGHFPVQQYQARRFRCGQDIPGLSPVFGQHRIEAPFLDDSFEHDALRQAVVADQYLHDRNPRMACFISS